MQLGGAPYRNVSSQYWIPNKSFTKSSIQENFVSGNATQKAEKQQIKDIVIDNGFVDTLKKSITILAPIDHLIVKYQSVPVPVSEVVHD